MSNNFPWIVLPIWAILGILFIGYTIRMRKKRGPDPILPPLGQDRILYQENFASGRSLENGITRIGGARNCLKLIVTQDELRVSFWFELLPSVDPYDLKHRIPKKTILSVRQVQNFFTGRRLLIEFRRTNGRTAILELAPKNVEGFLQALGIKVE